MTSVLQKKYVETLAGELSKELGRKNILALPRLLKVSVSSGIGKAVTLGAKDYSYIEENLAAITGQKAALRKSKKSISNFKLRKGLPVGLTVTLRGERMYDFIYKFVNTALPRVRDFQGITVKGFDSTGNFSIGLRDITIFPEVNAENLSKVHGLQININTTARNSYEAYLLLKGLGFPFKDSVKEPQSK